jgi:S1-C subfamily serine protease
MIANAPKPEDLAPAASLVRISAPGATPAARTVAQAATGGVTILGEDGSFGSGVLVSSDGYVLTNEHVVGKAKTVTVRWADKAETPGEVVRVHRGRDVALIKTDPKGHAPLAIRSGLLDLGEAVMAIGAPLDTELSGTVTRGIVSTPSRKYQGFDFIQSDVAVTHGNSGGALIDDKSHLVGLTDLGFGPQGSSLNLFIPIEQALDFVGLDLAASPPPAAPATKASLAAPPASVRKK